MGEGPKQVGVDDAGSASAVLRAPEEPVEQIEGVGEAAGVCVDAVLGDEQAGEGEVVVLG